jgi:hypothetical protein
MNNLVILFSAYVVGCAVFFIFYLTVARRTSLLREDLERL